MIWPFVIIAGLVALAVSLAAASVWVIWKFDPARKWDHVARTMTQFGIGIVSVLIAVVIFLQQAHQQDARLFAQQANLSAAFIRSIIVALGLDVKELLSLDMQTMELKCRTAQECDADGATRRAYARQRGMLRHAMQRTEATRPLWLEDRRYTEQVRELVRTSYVLGPRIVGNLLDSANAYHRALDNTQFELNKLTLELSVVVGQENPSPSVLSAQYAKLAAIQTENVTRAAFFVCSLHTIERLLSDPDFRTRAEPLADTPTGENDFYMCSVPNYEAFDDYLQFGRKLRGSR